MRTLWLPSGALMFGWGAYLLWVDRANTGALVLLAVSVVHTFAGLRWLEPMWEKTIQKRKHSDDNAKS